jgi:hypothetical protein
MALPKSLAAEPFTPLKKPIPSERVSAMTDAAHRFKIGQTVELITSTLRSAATGGYEIISLRPSEGSSDLKYRVKSRSESHERVVSESELVSSATPNFDGD